MSTAAYVEMIGGASGNMLAGALVDAGADIGEIEEMLRTIPLEGWTIERKQVVKRGIAATYLDVVVPGEDAHNAHPLAPEARAHRTLAEILAIVQASRLTASQKERASSIYIRLAEAEARVHGTTIERITFHEVGQVDAIVDVAATCVALDLLGIERLFCSPYPIGRGMIAMHHGLYPNPPPATAELMRGAPTFALDVDGETVTTTAAAILATLVAAPGLRPAMRWERIGYGAGRSDFAVPNVTRVVVGALDPNPIVPNEETIIVLEANIDDMSPQHFELAHERLFAAGAYDVWTTAIGMKKSRPGVLLSVIVPVDRADACARTMLRETTTLGVRMQTARRLSLSREIVTVETPFGAVRVKRAWLDGSCRASIEYEDLARIARERGKPIGEIARTLAAYVGGDDASP